MQRNCQSECWPNLDAASCRSARLAFLAAAEYRSVDIPSYYRARYYDPTSGRFLSDDPLEFGGGDANFYRYVWNSPLDWIDPRGNWGVGVTGGGTVGVGVGPAGVATGGGGVGVFYNPGHGVSSGAFGQGGATLAIPGDDNSSTTYPPGPGNKLLGGVGAAVGVGGGAFLTNAKTVCVLKGPFNTVLVDFGVGPVSVEVQLSWGNGTFILSGTGGPGIGALAAKLNTNTSVHPFGGTKCGCGN